MKAAEMKVPPTVATATGVGSGADEPNDGPIRMIHKKGLKVYKTRGPKTQTTTGHKREGRMLCHRNRWRNHPKPPRRKSP